MNENDDIRATDELRRRIETMHAAKLIDYQALSMLVRPTNKSYIQQFVTRGSPKEMKPRMREVLSAALDEAEQGRRRRIVGSYDPDAEDDDIFDAENPSLGSVTGIRGVPDDASPQLDLTGGLGAGGIALEVTGVPGKYGMTFTAEQIRDYWRLPPAILVALGLAAHQVAIIPVQGDSMTPTLNEGDVVFIDTRHRLPSPSGLYAILDEIGGVVVKRLEIVSPPGAEQQMVAIISDNPRHIRKEWRAEDVHIIGRVLRKFGNIG